MARGRRADRQARGRQIVCLGSGRQESPARVMTRRDGRRSPRHVVAVMGARMTPRIRGRRVNDRVARTGVRTRPAMDGASAARARATQRPGMVRHICGRVAACNDQFPSRAIGCWTATICVPSASRRMTRLAAALLLSPPRCHQPAPLRAPGWQWLPGQAWRRPKCCCAPCAPWSQACSRSRSPC